MAKLTPAQQKFIDKFIGDVSETETVVIRNRFSGTPSTVSKRFAAVYTLIMNIEAAFDRPSALARIHPDLKPSNQIQNFDRARMVCLALDNKAYLNLLD